MTCHGGTGPVADEEDGSPLPAKRKSCASPPGKAGWRPDIAALTAPKRHGSQEDVQAIFTERCTSCHGVDGQGVAVGDKKPGPLWGPSGLTSSGGGP